MATTEDFRVGNGGSVLHLTFKKSNVAFSLVGATRIVILIRKKDGTTVLKDAEIENTSGSGIDGKVKYVFSIEDLDQEGEWKAQGFARFDAVTQVYTSIVSFKVGANLETVPPDTP
jgi:hypothetical protein